MRTQINCCSRSLLFYWASGTTSENTTTSEDCMILEHTQLTYTSVATVVVSTAQLYCFKPNNPAEDSADKACPRWLQSNLYPDAFKLCHLKRCTSVHTRPLRTANAAESQAADSRFDATHPDISLIISSNSLLVMVELTLLKNSKNSCIAVKGCA